MLPENVELRKRHAPLSEFVERTCRTGLLFQPGDAGPLSKHGDSAGRGDCGKNCGPTAAPISRVQRVRAAPNDPDVAGPGWSQDCRYGANARWPNPATGTGTAPIGATLPCRGAEHIRRCATWRDLSRHLPCRALRRGRNNTRRETREIQTGSLRPSYGLGWMRDPGAFGQGCSPATFGHYGSTGTLFWHDPESHSDLCAVDDETRGEFARGRARPGFRYRQHAGVS